MSVPTIAQKGPYPVQVEAGKSYYWCSCGLSKNQPFCEGSHAGTGLSPIKFEAPETKTVYLCGCKSSKSGVFCDGMKAKTLSLGASMFVMALLLFPTGAYAQFGGIFSAILSTITGPIGGALTDINQIRSSILKTEQQVLWPVTLITQAQNYISTIKASYRGWMNQVYTLPVNSANLQMPKSLESAFLSGQVGQAGGFSQSYTSTYGVQPASEAAPQLNLQMMDIEDAVAKDATVQSMAADQATTKMLQTEQRIEDEAQTTAPGTAAMVAAEARTAELASLAMQHKLLAYQLREAAIQLGHRGSILKQSTSNTKNLNQQILNHLGGGQ